MDGRGYEPIGHITSKQRRIDVEAWRRIDAELTLFQGCVLAGRFVLKWAGKSNE